MLKIILSTVCFLVLAEFVCCKNEVDTTHGRISGKSFKTIYEERKYEAFMGIPFAAPPVKELRFKPPQPLDPWDGVLHAYKIKPACVQFNTNVRKGQPFGTYGRDDCLYLDIYTPAIDEKQRPVVIFLHSERLRNSYNKTKDYSPDFFIEEDLVVVTISHRLAVFGFLSLEDKTLPGNAGLKDIVQALEWISNNIKSFGGNPDKITLLGSQGGAAAVELLIRSKAKKFFHSAILQSGSAIEPAYLQEGIRERAFKLGELLNITTTNGDSLLQELNKAESVNILTVELRASPDDYFKENQRSILSFSPIVENDPDGLITEYPENSSQSINIPIMIGFNSQEGLGSSLIYLIEPRYMHFLRKDFPLLMPLRLKFKFDPLHDAYFDAIEDLKKFYFTDGKISAESIPEYTTYIGDISGYTIDNAVKILANRSDSPIYYYHFDYYSDLNENTISLLNRSTVKEVKEGAATGDELCYLFRCPSLNDKYKTHKQLNSEVFETQRKLIKLWANFVKHGNPTPTEENPLGIEWPAYDSEMRQYLLLGKHMAVKNDLRKERFLFWDEFISKWQKKAELGLLNDNKKDEL